MINTIILGHVLNVLPKLPAESVSCITTSPPYWSLRDYGVEPVIWDGDKDCKHEFDEYNSKLLHENRQNLDGGTIGNPEYRENLHGFGNAKAGFCSKCGAWCGNLGLEPTFELYIKHLCDIFDEVKRVLRKDGTCWVNMGDSYNGSKVGNTNASTGAIGKPKYSGDFTKTFKKENQRDVPTKSLCLIPQRFAIEMVNRGWILRNTIIWYKPNCMPASANDRFTIDFEYLFFFTKNNKTLFWTNKKTLECTDKKPLGTKGKECIDWEWRETQDWKEEENAGYEMGATDPHRAASIGGLKLGAKHKKSGKLKKVSLWTGHDYWFEQQFEEHLTQENRPDGKDINYGKQGRNKRCVWIIPTQPFPEAHFAVYPEGLIEIPIKAGCPEFICKKCGKARVKILEPSKEYKKLLGHTWKKGAKGTTLKEGFRTPDKKVSCTADYIFKNYSNCGCSTGWESGIVLDPFMGAGTSALVALKQRKRFIGIEIKQEYIDMSYKRIKEVQQNLF